MAHTDGACVWQTCRLPQRVYYVLRHPTAGTHATPVDAGVQGVCPPRLDSRLRGNDKTIHWPPCEFWLFVTPAEAGVQGYIRQSWIPAFAGMTRRDE